MMKTSAAILGLALVALSALPARAMTQQQLDWCYSPTATDDQTIEGCTAVIESGPYTSGHDLSTAYNSRAVGYYGKGELDLAIADENRAIDLDTTNAEAHSNRCNDYNDKGLYDQAIADCNQAIALKPGYAHAYENRGNAYEKKGLRDQAIADYRAALKFKPDDQKTKDALQRLGATP